MKRCPTCDRTFDDNMRFCQTDGTPLVDAPEPVDPYKTMVARPEDIAAAIPPTADKFQPETRAEDEVLEIPPVEASDPKKTMYASEAEIRRAMDEVDSGDNQVIDVPPLDEPAPPQFIEPGLGSRGGPPPSPFGASDDSLTSKTTPPIPSPFDNVPRSEPAEQRFEAPDPERPAFAEPDRAAAADPFGSPFAANEPSSPLAQTGSTPPAAQDTNWQEKPMQNPQFQSAAGATQSKTLAIISLVLGILGLLCCSLFVPSLAAVITGFMARGKANSDPSAFGGSGLAVAGIILGVVGMLGGVAYWIFLLFFGGMELLMREMPR